MSKEIETVNPREVMPDFIKQEQHHAGLAELGEVVRPSTLKLVQKQSDDKLVETFGIGSAVLQPAGEVIAKRGEVFHITPLAMFRQFITWTPIEARGSLPAIIEATTDKNSALARKAQNPGLWSEDIVHNGIPVRVRHQEHLNFLIVLQDHKIGDEPMIVSFARAEHRTGSQWASLIRMRKASMYNGVYEVRVCQEPRKNDQGSWFGLDIVNPSTRSPWVTQEQSVKFAEMHEEFMKIAKANRVEVSYDGDDTLNSEVHDNEEL